MGRGRGQKIIDHREDGRRARRKREMASRNEDEEKKNKMNKDGEAEEVDDEKL